MWAGVFLHDLAYSLLLARVIYTTATEEHVTMDRHYLLTINAEPVSKAEISLVHKK